MRIAVSSSRTVIALSVHSTFCNEISLLSIRIHATRDTGQYHRSKSNKIAYKKPQIDTQQRKRKRKKREGIDIEAFDLFEQVRETKVTCHFDYSCIWLR
ncbi:hypothetical protein ALC60_06730 [Trachymyrmex zeteki]|uniref:Uncharacterized protein n=1 Tax=Mycetomoellerius zeteki TaxID=64791 RepID=A0A151X1B5_9HYME|nr:hypothetical protein ALC60_06730 [Trachymyrmex zeteki]